MSSRPRRKHKLRHPTGTTPPASPLERSSPFTSPLRFTPRKSLLRISSPKATKSPLLSSTSKLARMLPGALPFDAGRSSNSNNEVSGGLPMPLPLLEQGIDSHHDRHPNNNNYDNPIDDDDEHYPEVPQSPMPKHQQQQLSSNNNEDEEVVAPDDISSVSSGSKNGDIVMPQKDSNPSSDYNTNFGDNGDKHGQEEEWEFRQFHGTQEQQEEEQPVKRNSASKKMGKLLLGKNRRRFLFKKDKKKKNNKNKDENASAADSQESQHHQNTTSLEMQQQQQQQQYSQSQELSSSLELQLPKQELADQAPQQQRHQQQPRAANSAEQQLQQQQPLLSPIRIKRQRKVEPQSQNNVVQQQQQQESPPMAPRRQIQIRKGRHRGGAVGPKEKEPVRSDALWTQTILVDHTTDSEEENGKNNKGKHYPITMEEEDENVTSSLVTNDSAVVVAAAAAAANSTPDTTTTILPETPKQPETVPRSAALVMNDTTTAAKNNTTAPDAKTTTANNVDASNDTIHNNTPDTTIRSDHLWAQSMVDPPSKEEINHDDNDSYDNILLTPTEASSILSPPKKHSPSSVTTTKLPIVVAPSNTESTVFSFELPRPIANMPNLKNEKEQPNENGDDKDDDVGKDDDKMDITMLGRQHGHDDTDRVEVGEEKDCDDDDDDDLTATKGSRTTTNSTTTPGEDGNIVDEDDLLDLIPSDEQHDEDENDDGDEYKCKTRVEEKDNRSTDSNYYFQQVLSDDEDDEGGVVSEHDEELILEELQNLSSISRPRTGSVADGDLIPSDILSQDSNSMDMIGPTDEESNNEVASIAGRDHHGKVSAPQSPCAHPSAVVSEMAIDKFDIVPTAAHQHPESVEALNTASHKRQVDENLNTTIDSNFTLNDSDLADMENKEKPFFLSDRSSLANMQHRLLSMRTIKDSYKKKLLLQEQETVQLQVQLLASQYEAREAKMAVQSAETALTNARAKLRASENDREQQKALLINLREQLSIVQTQLHKSQLMMKTKKQDGHSQQSSQPLDTSAAYDKKIMSMEDQLLVQDEEMDQLAMQIQELKGKMAESELAKGEAEQKWKEALARENSLKVQLSGQSGMTMMTTSANGSDRHDNEIQRLENLIKANDERYQAETLALRNQLENVQKTHESEVAKLRGQVERNKKLASSSQKEAELARTKLLQELADAKLEHARTIQELRETLSNTHEQEKTKLHTQYTNELERLEDEIVGSRSELSV